jgi:hypothetical protein
MEKELEKLINTKCFEELSKQEKEYVLKFITEDEYNSFFELLATSQRAFQEEYEHVNPKEHVKENLKLAFQSKHSKSIFNFPKINFSFQNPTFYKTAFALGSVVILILIYFFPQKTAPNKQQTSKNIHVKEKIKIKKDIPSEILMSPELENNEKQPNKIEPTEEPPSDDYDISTEEFLMATTQITPSDEEILCLTTEIDDMYKIKIEDFIQYTSPLYIDEY